MLLEWLSIVGARLRRKPQTPTPSLPKSRYAHMYRVTQLEPRRFACWGMVQDGHETWERKTLEAATDSMVVFARVMNGTEITPGDMSIATL